ncbi:hypothetical protein ZWY2020_045102 [Hordeum vulgare]|nr:hypothetical protein ZWY2020_045102 [Hordeum vulgare]
MDLTAATHGLSRALLFLSPSLPLPEGSRFQQPGLTTTALLRPTELKPKDQGQPETLDYRVFLVDSGGRKERQANKETSLAVKHIDHAVAACSHFTDPKEVARLAELSDKHVYLGVEVQIKSPKPLSALLPHC